MNARVIYIFSSVIIMFIIGLFFTCTDPGTSKPFPGSLGGAAGDPVFSTPTPSGGFGTSVSGLAAATATAPQAASVAGTWRMEVDVEGANGACAGLEDDDLFFETITIVQSASGGGLTVTGFAGATGPWQGTFDGTMVRFGGTSIRNIGLTTASFTLAYHGTARMTGTFTWSATGPNGSCPNGTGSVKEAVRLN